MAKTRENIQAFTPDNENAERRVAFLANPQIDWNVVSGQPKSN
jgi:hypothetical protein